MHRFNDNLTHWHSNEELLRALIAESVDFVLVGGLAVAWYCESRQADDMNLLVAPTPENSERIYRALLSLSLSNFSVDSFAKARVRAQLRKASHAELLTPSAGGPHYAEMVQSSAPAKLSKISIRVPCSAVHVAGSCRAEVANHDGRENAWRMSDRVCTTLAHQ